MSVDYVYDWIKIIGVTVPPLCVEVFLKDGNRYYLHSVGIINEENGSLVLRIWDFRAFSPEDIEELKVRLNDIQSLDNETAIHPKLDWTNLRLHLNDIAYCVEWHDRLWPEAKRPKIGFVKND